MIELTEAEEKEVLRRREEKAHRWEVEMERRRQLIVELRGEITRLKTQLVAMAEQRDKGVAYETLFPEGYVEYEVGFGHV